MMGTLYGVESSFQPHLLDYAIFLCCGPQPTDMALQFVLRPI